MAERKPFKLFLYRIPWILIGLVGGLLTAGVISGFEGTLEEHIILAFFMPLVAYLSDAVGNQTQTMFIRDLAVRNKISKLKYTFTQAIAGSLIGIVCWAIISGVTHLFWNDLYVGFVIGLSIFIATLVASFLAMGIPGILKLFGQDPAIGSGPFTTIIQDLLSIIIYFIVATALL